jgi:hypothetical protein
MWMVEFSCTYMFWPCVTLGFSNSVIFTLKHTRECTFCRYFPDYYPML